MFLTLRKQDSTHAMTDMDDWLIHESTLDDWQSCPWQESSPTSQCSEAEVSRALTLCDPKTSIIVTWETARHTDLCAPLQTFYVRSSRWSPMMCVPTASGGSWGVLKFGNQCLRRIRLLNQAWDNAVISSQTLHIVFSASCHAALHSPMAWQSIFRKQHPRQVICILLSGWILAALSTLACISCWSCRWYLALAKKTWNSWTSSKF